MRKPHLSGTGHTDVFDDNFLGRREWQEIWGCGVATEITKDCRPCVVRIGDMGIVDGEVLKVYSSRQAANVAEIVRSRIGTGYDGKVSLVPNRTEGAVTDDDIAVPCAPVIVAKPNECASVHLAILDKHRAEANGLNTHVPKGAASQGDICHAHVGIEA